MAEIWKQIKNTKWMVSNLGRVKDSRGVIKRGDDRGNGYLKVRIGEKTIYIHHLVADAFLSNPENKQCIDHINTDKTDNRVENLRWCTHKENTNNPITLKRIKEICNKVDNKLGNIARSKKVQCVETGVIYENCRDASNDTGIFIQNIRNAANPNNRHRSAGGYTWQYKEVIYD